MHTGLQRQRTALKVGFWLGWKTESNWTNPVFYVIWSMIPSLSSALILTFMVRVLQQAGGGSGPNLLPYVFIGSVVYSLVGSLLDSMSWAVLEDRERMGMLKYIAIAPSSLYAYLFGRGFAKVATNFIAVPLTLTVGVLALGIPIHPATIDWGLLAAVLPLGVLIITSAGLILAGVTMMIAKHAGFLGQAVSGALYLFTGTLFPLTVLPAPLQAFARALPLTYWVEGMRRALWADARNPAYNSGLDHLGDGTLVLILAGCALLMLAISLPLEGWAERRAKEKGLLDMNTAY